MERLLLTSALVHGGLVEEGILLLQRVHHDFS